MIDRIADAVAFFRAALTVARAGSVEDAKRFVSAA